MLLGVLDYHVLLSAIGSSGVRSCTSNSVITPSGSNMTKMMPSNPPKMLFEVIKDLEAALR